MNYTISEIANMSGGGTRTLRYYDEIGLLKPTYKNESGYRIYSSDEVDKLQQILFYRELGFDLNVIRKILSSEKFDKLVALEEHLIKLDEENKRINLLIKNVKDTIKSLKGEFYMLDEEKFKGFKINYIKENEEKYGEEIRNKYGDAVVDSANENLKKLDKQQWVEKEDLETQILDLLKLAVQENNPLGETAKRLYECHKKWICMQWGEGRYSKCAHKGLVEMYLNDERFKAYYDNAVPGGAQFLHDAIIKYCDE